MKEVDILEVLRSLRNNIEVSYNKYSEKKTAKNKKALRIALETYLVTLNEGFEKGAIGGDPFGVYLRNGLEEGILHEMVIDIIKKNDFHVYEFVSLVTETQDMSEKTHKEGVVSKVKGKMANGAEYLFDSKEGKIVFLWRGAIKKIQVFKDGVKILLMLIMQAMTDAYKATTSLISKTGDNVQEKWNELLLKYNKEESYQAA